MTLYDLGIEYERSAEPLRQRLKELRAALKEAEEPEERWRLKQRISELTPMLTEMNKLNEYCKRYYERGYFINDGPFARRQRFKPSAKERASATGCPTHIEKRTYAETADCCSGMFIQSTDVRRLSKRARRKQKHYFQELLSGLEKTC